jgi:hypothetical protein
MAKIISNLELGPLPLPQEEGRRQSSSEALAIERGALYKLSYVGYA